MVAELFEAHRGQLRAVAYRMLGSLDQAEDAVQEVWPRMCRADLSQVRNLAGWLTTVVSRVCLDMLRARRARPEEPAGHGPTFGSAEPVDLAGGPEPEAELVDSVGRALLVVLDRLEPAERVAFVLHDLFAVPHEEIASVLERSTPAAKKLASRARYRVRGDTQVPGPGPGSAPGLAEQRRVVDAFLAAARGGDLDALLAVLAPDVVRRSDPAALPSGAPAESRGARAVAGETMVIGRRARFAEAALVDGAVGALVAPGGRLRLVLTFHIVNGRITAYRVIADPDRLARLTLTVLPTGR
jgi:RNA polymerase sigma-70 factor (ECF subfamily)